MPTDKKLNYSRAAGMNRSESLGATTSTINRMSRHNQTDKIDMSHMTQAPEKIMHAGSCHFIEPTHEPWWVPVAFLPDPMGLAKRVYRKRDKFLQQCRSSNGDKTQSAEHYLNVVLKALSENVIRSCELIFLIFPFNQHANDET